MKIIKCFIGFFSAFAILFISPSAFAEMESITKLQADIIAPWLVTVEGESKTRTLQITKAKQKQDGILVLEAVYGWTDGKQASVKAEVDVTAQENKLVITTPADTTIIAMQTPNGTFTGTFTTKNGVTKAVTLVKLSGNELQSQVASAQTARVATLITKPAADVPPACAAFSGKWTGTWSQGGIGQNWLWIVKVDANCTAKFAYLSHANPPKGFATAEIKDGVLSFLCNRSTGGTCNFKLHGETLWANYSNSIGGNNNATFERIQ